VTNNEFRVDIVVAVILQWMTNSPPFPGLLLHPSHRPSLASAEALAPPLSIFTDYEENIGMHAECKSRTALATGYEYWNV